MKTRKQINEKIASLSEAHISINLLLDAQPMGDRNQKIANDLLETATLKKRENLTRTEIMFVKHELQGMLTALRWVKKKK
ncbi:MAG: hypothetical protein ACLFUH_05420 [Bacteroidales bacterium]